MVDGDPLTLLHPDDRERAATFFGRGGPAAGGDRPVEWRFRQPDGTWLHAEILVATNLLERPDVRGIVLNTRDVTERKAARGAARPPGVPRRAHRPGQPGPVPRPGRATRWPGRGARGRPGRAVPRPRRLQDRQRQPRPRRRRPAAAWPSAERLPAACARARHGRPARRRRVRRAARGAPTPTTRPTVAERVLDDPAPAVPASTAAASRSGPASASPPARPRRATRPTSCCATPTWPCTRPRPAARAGYELFRARHARRTASSGSSCEADAAPARSSASELVLHYQPIVELAHAAGSPGSRRWSAGTTRARACCPRPTFIPLAEETGLIVPHRQLGAARGLPPGAGAGSDQHPARAAVGAASTCPAASSSSTDLVDERGAGAARRPGSTPRRWSSRSPRAS